MTGESLRGKPDVARCGRIMIGSGGDSWDPTCDLPDPNHMGACYSFSATDQHRLEHRCAQCGREGERGFKIIPSDDGRPYVVCANANACRKRWPR